MGTRNRHHIGKILYGGLFTLLLPGLLILWARSAHGDIARLPPVLDPSLGWSLVAVGGILGIIGTLDLARYGRGLPMNAFPPERFVSVGLYRYLPHPIYIGFSFVCFGLAIATGSPSGFWLVAPVATLGAVALVLGYERPELRARFGDTVTRPLVAIPLNSQIPPTAWNRISVYLLLFLPWLILYESVLLLGVPPDAIDLRLPFERTLPVLEWTELFYFSAYILVLIAPLLATQQRQLRWFIIAGLLSTFLVTFAFITIPITAPPRPFIPTGIMGELLILERSFDSAAAAFPSFHAVWAMLAVGLLARARPRLRTLWWLWGLGILLSCVTTGMHAIADVIGGIALALIVARYATIWEYLRSQTERVANSWREWRIGPVRFINHGLYAGIGTVLGLSLVGALLGSNAWGAMLVVGISTLLGAAIWAQVVEGSSRLLRPFGYYGGIIGGVVGCLLIGRNDGDIWRLLGAFSIGAPIIQSFGRFRCLVQGCCHGRTTSEKIGIHYRHPQSRVLALSKFGGEPLHPTPLYSILWNLPVAAFLLRLAVVGASGATIAGLYLILTGLGRFVEEGYRGEPQTRIVAGLRLYQWIAIATVVVGATITTLPIQEMEPYNISLNLKTLGVATILGIITTLAMGLDLPLSNRKFSKLAE